MNIAIATMWKYCVPRVWIFIPVIIAAFLYVPFLSSRPLEDADEATYAIVAREAIESGQYGTLTFFGNAWVDKPPLF